MNPYAIIAALVLAAALWFGGDHQGFARGIDKQKVDDQAEFDRINGDLARQKAEAAAIMDSHNAAIIALMDERARANATLETQREQHRKATDDLRRQYAGVGLRFKPEQNGFGWPSGGGALRAGSDPAGPSCAEAVQLPAALTASLRQLVADADELNDDYRKCADAWTVK